MPNNKKQETKLTKPSVSKELTEKQMQDKIKALVEFFDQYGIDYDKFSPDNSQFLNALQTKKAYPNNEAMYIHTPPAYDIQKWLMAVKNVHYLQKSGKLFTDAIKQITGTWKPTETYSFLNWLRFYNEGANLKYKKIAEAALPGELTKTAQNWYESSNQPGYFLHIKKDTVQPEAQQDIQQSVDSTKHEVEDKIEKKRIIEKQRQKIIGRLDSAEKLLRTTDGQMFADKELESIMEAIYNLKKKIQLVNKLSTATRLYEDMIVREANILNKKGFVRAANTLYSIAQTPGASADLAPNSNIEEGHENLTTPSPPDPIGAGQSGVPSGLPAIVPGVPSNNTSSNSDQNLDQPPLEAFETQPAGIKEFVENMNAGNKTEANEVLEVQDNEEPLTVEAQALPQSNIPPAVLEDIPITDSPKPDRNPPSFVPVIPKKETADKEKPLMVEEPVEETTIEEPLEVNEDDITATNNKIDNLFSGSTIEDVIEHLKGTVQIYRNNELSRRLAYIDMLLNSLNLSSLFPSLLEAQSKAIDSTQYIRSRLEDILSQLEGTIKSTSIDLVSKQPMSPQAKEISNKLEQEAAKEKARKEQRKEKENAMPAVPSKETPQVELNQLNEPTQIVPPRG